MKIYRPPRTTLKQIRVAKIKKAKNLKVWRPKGRS